MAWLGSDARNGLRCGFLGLAAAAATLMITSDAADARHHRRAHVHFVHVEHVRVHRHARAEEYAPPGSSIVVDGNDGSVLQASNPDALRHPASLTKVMTLYLLFERLDAGKMSLDTPLKVSEHASEAAPTKLDLKPGQTISVEDAIKGIVTRSANDAAVTIAENLGGDEETFAKMMTQKAHALGMTRTTYVNASGLPDDDQITTARDQALLGRAIQDRFPRYYKYFSTESFVYHGEAIRSHNHLLGAIDGVDGIKTGFTRASGFNLLTSVHRDGHFIVAVVMGGHSAFERDAHMRELIGEHIKEAAVRRTAPLIADAPTPREDAQPVAFAKAPMAAHADPAPTASVNPRPAPVAAAKTTASQTAATQTTAAQTAVANANDPIRPLLVRTITYRTAPVQSAALAPMPSLVPVAAQAPAAQPVATQTALRQQVAVASAAPVPTVAAHVPQPIVAAPPAPVVAQAATAEPDDDAPIHAEVADAGPTPSVPTAALHSHGGWLIQIGAFDDENDAKQHLSAAQSKLHSALAAADPFTERVQKGDKALYRARFAGFNQAAAEAACKQLKHSDIDCMALKD